MIQDSFSLRGASKATERILVPYIPSVKVPKWQTGRLWMLRVGHYELEKEKEKADDWIWVVDHNVQIGSIKCFLDSSRKCNGLMTKEYLIRCLEIKAFSWT